MDAVLRLPPVDVYRAPFVMPIGHLAMQTAFAEDGLINLCAAVGCNEPSNRMTHGEVAHQLRNWGDRAQAFLSRRLALLEPGELRTMAEEVVERYKLLRQKRHRALHDAVSVGFDEEEGVQPLSVEYRRDSGGTTEVRLNNVLPSEIADLAYQMYEVQKDLEHITYAISGSSDD